MVEQAVIVAAGRGQRLGVLLHDRPKGLLAVGGQHLVPRSVQLLRGAGIKQVIIGTGYLAEQYAAAFAGQSDVVCVPHDGYRETGNMQTLYALRHHLDGDFLLLESDLLYEPRALDALLHHPAATVLLVSQVTGARDAYFVGTNSHSRLVAISQLPTDLDRLSGEFVGINKVAEPVYQKMCGFWEQQRDQQPLLNYEDVWVALAHEVPIVVARLEGLVWCEIDTPEHLTFAEETIVPALLAQHSVYASG